MTSRELEALPGLLDRARHIVIGTDTASRADAEQIAEARGDLVPATATRPDPIRRPPAARGRGSLWLSAAAGAGCR